MGSQRVRDNWATELNCEGITIVNAGKAQSRRCYPGKEGCLFEILLLCFQTWLSPIPFSSHSWFSWRPLWTSTGFSVFLCLSALFFIQFHLPSPTRLCFLCNVKRHSRLLVNDQPAANKRGEEKEQPWCWQQPPIPKATHRFKVTTVDVPMTSSTETELPSDPAIPLLGIYPKRVDTLIQKDHSPVFAAALFTIAETRKDCTCPSRHEWREKMWQTHTHSAVKSKKSCHLQQQGRT